MSKLTLNAVDSSQLSVQASLLPSTASKGCLFLKSGNPPVLHLAKNIGGSFVEINLEGSSVLYANYGSTTSWDSSLNVYVLGTVAGFTTPPTSLGAGDAGLMLKVEFNKFNATPPTQTTSAKLTWGTQTYNLTKSFNKNGDPIYLHDEKDGEIAILTWSGDATIGFVVYDSYYNNISNVTYATLNSLISSNKLVEGSFYRIKDYITTYLDVSGLPAQASGSVFTVPTEPLIVQATSENTLAAIAYSERFPEDVIHYSIVSPAWMGGQGKGEIVYRKDTLNNVETYYDFRGVLFPRTTVDTITKTTWDGILLSSQHSNFSQNPITILESSLFVLELPYADAQIQNGEEIVLTSATPTTVYFPTFPLNTSKEFSGSVKNVSIAPSCSESTSLLLSDYPTYVDCYNNIVINADLINNVSLASGCAGITFTCTDPAGINNFNSTGKVIGCVFDGSINGNTFSGRIYSCLFLKNFNFNHINCSVLEYCVFGENTTKITLEGSISKQRFVKFSNNSGNADGFSNRMYSQQSLSTFDLEYMEENQTFGSTKLGRFTKYFFFIRPDYRFVGKWKFFNNTASVGTVPVVTDGFTEYPSDSSNKTFNKIVFLQKSNGDVNDALHVVEFLNYRNLVSTYKTKYINEFQLNSKNSGGWLLMERPLVFTKNNGLDWISFSPVFDYVKTNLNSDYFWKEVNTKIYMDELLSPYGPFPNFNFRAESFADNYSASSTDSLEISFLIDRLECIDDITATLLSPPAGFSFSPVSGSDSVLIGTLNLSGVVANTYTLNFQMTGCEEENSIIVSITVIVS